MPHLHNRIFTVIQQKQNGKCHHCKRNITLSDILVSNGAWLVQIKAGGHGLMFQDPEEFSNIVLTFLKS